MIFGTHYEYRGNSTPFEWDVAHTMQGKLLLPQSVGYLASC